MKYCIKCGSDKINFNIPEGDNLPRFNCSKCDYIHYSNPRIIVGCLIYDDNKVLLAKRAIEPRNGLWNLPAGFMEEGEDVAKGAAREAYEETGFIVDIESLHCIYSVPHVSQVFVIFKASIKEKTDKKTPETSELRFFNKEDIPWNDLAFSSNTFALRKFFESILDSKEVHVGLKS